jgi:molybdopterin-guanine dinucleotide biosynthesis protein A
MIQKKNLILIGGAGRNVGKTVFACRLIERRAHDLAVTGIKITVMDPPDTGHHDRVEEGTYRAFDGPFQILEETAPSNATDTGRMLIAGARRVFWLKVRRDRLQEGLEALMKLVPDDACLVAEGTSARTVIEPGLFIVIRAKNDAAMKESCAAVLPLADRVAEFDGRGWDARPDDCLFVEGEWMLRPRAGAVVLAGGDSRRMGRDKALLPVEGRPMIALIIGQLRALFEEIVISANRPDDFGFLGLTVVPDLEPGQGPLRGIASSLPRMTHDLNFVTACDIPRIDLSFVNRLIKMADGYDLVLPYLDEGLYEPLFAAYRKSVVPEATRILEGGGRSILELLDRVKVNLLPIPDRSWVRNINTDAEYADLIADRAERSPKK